MWVWCEYRAVSSEHHAPTHTRMSNAPWVLSHHRAEFNVYRNKKKMSTTQISFTIVAAARWFEPMCKQKVTFSIVRFWYCAMGFMKMHRDGKCSKIRMNFYIMLDSIILWTTVARAGLLELIFGLNTRKRKKKIDARCMLESRWDAMMCTWEVKVRAIPKIIPIGGGVGSKREMREFQTRESSSGMRRSQKNRKQRDLQSTYLLYIYSAHCTVHTETKKALNEFDLKGGIKSNENLSCK